MADLTLRSKNNKNVLFRTWMNMKNRCYRKNMTFFERYGGRGIKVCKKWQTFDGFIEDMLPTYTVNLTLDRIDNNGNYCKENCKWSTSKEQANNTVNIERAYKITFMNKTKTISQWADELNIKRTTLGMRILKYKWSIEKSFNLGGVR